MSDDDSSSASLDTVLMHLPPKELHRYLLSRLDFSTMKAARCVNKLWQSLIDPCLDFNVILSDSSKAYVQAFGQTSREAESVATAVFQGKYPSDGISIRTKMLRLTYDSRCFEVTRLESIIKDGSRRQGQGNRLNGKYAGLTLFNLRRVLFDFRFVQKFHITSRAVSSFSKDAKQQLGRVFLPRVEEIIVTFFDDGFHQLLPFMKNYFPKLTSINIANVTETRKDRPILYSWVFGFVGRHRETVTHVSLILPEGIMDDTGSVLAGTVLGHRLPFSGLNNVNRDLRRDLKTPPNIYSDLKYRLENLTKLEKFIWDVGHLEGLRRYNLGQTLFFSQTQLVELHLDNLHLKDLPFWSRIGEALKKLSGTLESLSMGGCFCGPPTTTLLGAHIFSCTWIKDCHRLKSMEMVICGVSVDSIEDLPFKSIQILNLGHMLIHDQIEYVARHMTNLESWELPQRGCLVNILVPKINRYLFEAILYLPKLNKVNLYSECADTEDILHFISEEEGINLCTHLACILDAERNGNLNFHINRDKFSRQHSQLEDFMTKHRVNPVEQLNRDDLVEFFIRNIVAGRVHGIELADLEEDFDDWDVDEDPDEILFFNHAFFL